MIATLPACKLPRSLILVQGSVAIVLLLCPFFLILPLDRVRQAMIAGEYQSSRASILSSIDHAVERQDLDTLTEINRKYSRFVTDGAFRAAIRRALAEVAAREAAFELTISKHLDLLRHQEECHLPPDPIRPRIQAENTTREQQLPKLPR